MVKDQLSLKFLIVMTLSAILFGWAERLCNHGRKQYGEQLCVLFWASQQFFFLFSIFDLVAFLFGSVEPFVQIW